ncbi:NAD(P)/FAD-dependent oxidoreductase [Candidatus Woesearchaeota archaeon]|nr:NAD(P)/FAD-dependent oxidoreductase [Candidatus Woesearchaeota archaeon]MBW2978493.1 NAD(P)/FAD-dependent oxidoreductase [Candidatus Woesearchaeota archaeon]
MISIIGAGPVGNYCAYLLAKKGFKVNIFEEHPKAGIPVQCTGIVTKQLFKYVPKSKEFVINHFNKVQTVAPNNDYAEIPLEEYLLDRTRFDNYLLNKAQDAGAEVHFNHKFIEFKDNKAVIKNKQRLIHNQADYFIGADGPLSKVAESAGLLKNRQFFVGMQARVRGNFSKHTFTTFFGNNIAPGFFAWVVPESSSTARAGLATRKNTGFYFQNLLNSLNFTPIEYQGGLIPIFNPKQKVKKDNIFLIGDAAGFTKATTGGGLVFGLESAKIVSKCIVKNKKYNKEIFRLKFSLQLHRIIRNSLNEFKDYEHIKIIDLMKKKKIQNILKKNNREFPAGLLFKLILYELRLARFLKYLIISKKKDF